VFGKTPCCVRQEEGTAALRLQRKSLPSWQKKTTTQQGGSFLPRTEGPATSQRDRRDKFRPSGKAGLAERTKGGVLPGKGQVNRITEEIPRRRLPAGIHPEPPAIDEPEDTQKKRVGDQTGVYASRLVRESRWAKKDVFRVHDGV